MDNGVIGNDQLNTTLSLSLPIADANATPCRLAGADTSRKQLLPRPPDVLSVNWGADDDSSSSTGGGLIGSTR